MLMKWRQSHLRIISNSINSIAPNVNNKMSIFKCLILHVNPCNKIFRDKFHEDARQTHTNTHVSYKRTKIDPEHNISVFSWMILHATCTQYILKRKIINMYTNHQMCRRGPIKGGKLKTCCFYFIKFYPEFPTDGLQHNRNNGKKKQIID